MMRRMLVLCCWLSFCFGLPHPARGMDWDPEFDGEKPVRKQETVIRQMVGPASLGKGHVGLRLSGGLYHASTSLHFGMHDRIDVIVEGHLPYQPMGESWMAGLAFKFSLNDPKRNFMYGIKLASYWIGKSNEDGQPLELPPGLLLWPTFSAGLQTTIASFFGEFGTVFVPYTRRKYFETAAFHGLTLNVGGEINLSDPVHLYVKAGLLFLSPAAVLPFHLTSPFNLFEGGLIFIL
jgi:hypothetical protein